MTQPALTQPANSQPELSQPEISQPADGPEITREEMHFRRIDMRGYRRSDGLYEVAVTATVQTKIKDKTVFLVEAKQAGIFEIRHIPEDQMGPIMGIACPQIVYPYLRGNVADIVNRAGFPPVHLAEINFQAMYEQQQQQQQVQQPVGDAASTLAQ